MADILLADEMDLVIRGAHSVLKNETDWTVVGECCALSDALGQLSTRAVDVIICGEQVDPFYDVFSLVERLKAAAPAARLILIGSAADGRVIDELLQSGLRAYLHKADPLRDCLPFAVRTVLKGSPYLSPTANAAYLVAMQSGARRRPLNAEARRVLHLVARGHIAGSIAAQMCVPPRRIYWVCQKLRDYFGATTNAHMICCAIAEGYITAMD